MTRPAPLNAWPDDFFDGELIVQSTRRTNSGNPEVDSMFLTANTYFLLQQKFDVSPFFTSDSQPRRYYRPGAVSGNPYDNPNNVSRDNLMGMIIYLSWADQPELCKSIVHGILKRGSFFPNTHTTDGKKKALPDFAGLATWATLVRCLRNPWLYPVMCVLDIFMLLSIVFSVIFSPADRASTTYHKLSSLIYGTMYLPTPASVIAAWAYLSFRRKVKGYRGENGVISALNYYSRNWFDPKIQDVARIAMRREWGI